MLLDHLIKRSASRLAISAKWQVENSSFAFPPLPWQIQWNHGSINVCIPTFRLHDLQISTADRAFAPFLGASLPIPTALVGVQLIFSRNHEDSKMNITQMNKGALH